MEELYREYVLRRSVNLTLEQFILFSEFFPVVLVLLSDGVLDNKEKIYLEKLIRNLSNSFTEEGLGNKRVDELNKIFAREFEYLIQHLEEWKEVFLDTLKKHLENYPENKETILDTIELFAETSQDVNEAENDMVKFLTHKLNLIDSSVS